MSTGKAASQACHASVRGALASDINCRTDWLENGETKIVLEARDEIHLRTIKDYAAQSGIYLILIIDEGITEIPPLSITAAATYVVDRDDPNVKMAFGTLKTYKEPKPLTPPNRKWRWSEKLRAWV